MSQPTFCSVNLQESLIENIDKDYVVLIFGHDKTNPASCYLTNKSTGAVYLLGSAIVYAESKCPLPQRNTKEKHTEPL